METYDIRNLAERLFLEIRRCFVFAFFEVHRDEFERNLLLTQDCRDAGSAGCDVLSEEPEDHLSFGGRRDFFFLDGLAGGSRG